MNLIGEINSFISCLGLKEGDDKILEIVAIIATNFERIQSNYEGEKNTVYKFFRRGCEISFNEDNILDSIFIFIEKNEEYDSYPFLEDFITGINGYPTKREVIAVIGKPTTVSETWIKYQMNNKYLHFEFNDQEYLRQITLFINI